jgi:hypothetical protein
MMRLRSLISCCFLASTALFASPPAFAVDNERIDMRCAAGGEGVFIFNNGSHDKVVGEDTSILMEVNASLKSVITFDMVFSNDYKGKLITSAKTLKDLVVLEAIFAKAEVANVATYQPMLRVGDDGTWYTLYKFLDDYPILVAAESNRLSSSMTWQRCYVRSRTTVAH